MLCGGGVTTVGYFLTGEHRPYDRKAGAVDQVIPNCNFKHAVGGLGTWEVRPGGWSYCDVTAKASKGGTIQNMTAGLELVYDPNVRLCLTTFIRGQESPDLPGLIAGTTDNNCNW